MEAGVLSTELTYLGWSVVLLLVHIVAQAMSLTRDCGLTYNAGTRDEKAKVSALTDRLLRALRNFLETYAAFVALALALHVSGKAGDLGATGAMIWFWARVAYLPVYGLGSPFLRSAIWAGSILGLVLMLYQLLG